MRWRKSHRADRWVVPIADRHYSRQTPGSPQFVPPGRCLVLAAVTGPAYWVTSWPFAEYVKHEWPGAWVCSAFRNEGAGLSSELIGEAVAATRAFYGEPPEIGFITFVDKAKTRKKRDPGRCFRKAGWTVRGRSKGGLLCLGQYPADMPEPAPPIGWTPSFVFTD
jgi:hypothetical protein